MSPTDEKNNCWKMEKIEEMKSKKLKYKMENHIPGDDSVFLQKRLAKGTKFFDSGDYQMAKQKGSGFKSIFSSTGKIIPTPETVSVRKSYYNPMEQVSTGELPASCQGYTKIAESKL